MASFARYSGVWFFLSEVSEIFFVLSVIFYDYLFFIAIQRLSYRCASISYSMSLMLIGLLLKPSEFSWVFCIFFSGSYLDFMLSFFVFFFQF